MVKFNVELAAGTTLPRGGRIGRIDQWCTKKFDAEADVRTPSFLLYTRAGHVPHVTWNLVQKHVKFSQPMVLQFVLPSM